LEEVQIFRDARLLLPSNEPAPTAFLPFSFSGRDSPLKQFVECDDQLARARIEHALYDRAELHYLSLASPTQYFATHARVAALRIARGDVAGAISLMQDVLTRRRELHVPTSSEQRAHDGLIAASVGYAVTLGLQELQEVVRMALASVADLNTRDQFDCELAKVAIVQ
jgi:hypothetical protein